MSLYLIGVDEAGRGPLAGPVAVGVACVSSEFDWNLIPKVGDSKKLTEKVREEIYEIATQLRRDGLLDFKVLTASATVIDTIGIAVAVRRCVARGVRSLRLDPDDCEVRLDGLLYAPEEFRDQRTIPKGDASEPVIGLASILAKVHRDRYMKSIAKKPELAPYNLEIHKGYGTKAHCEAIKKYGLSNIHRASFCTRLHRVK